MTINGNHLIEHGHEPGPHFPAMIQKANEYLSQGHDIGEIMLRLNDMAPPPRLRMRSPSCSAPVANFFGDMRSMNVDEVANLNAVTSACSLVARVPTVNCVEVMPDACPAGALPVGGVAEAINAIHPGYHSADICCSVALTEFSSPAPDVFSQQAFDIMSAARSVTHFGFEHRWSKPAGFERYWRERFEDVIDLMRGNPFLRDLVEFARRDICTQGDGNHFLFIGRRRFTGRLTVVTHHGSRNLGARLYKKGMAAAKRMTRDVAVGIPNGHEWIPYDTQEGQDYWEALQIVRQWTAINHWGIHDSLGEVLGEVWADRFWNEHNFVFREGDSFIHAKGATPSYHGFAEDDMGKALIPMNMEHPILITEHADSGSESELMFAPHGAGRNMSRSEFLRRSPDGVAAPRSVHVDSYSGVDDASEFPGAYKDPQTVISAIKDFQLAHISDFVDPIGSIMAGKQPEPWRNK